MKHSKRAMRVGVAAVANHELAAKSTNGWRAKERERQTEREEDEEVGGRESEIYLATLKPICPATRPPMGMGCNL